MKDRLTTSDGSVTYSRSIILCFIGRLYTVGEFKISSWLDFFSERQCRKSPAVYL